MSQWFVIQNEKVAGPFSESEVKAQVAEGRLLGENQIWGRALNEWKTISWWMKESPQVINASVKPQSEQFWHYAVDGDSRGPFNRVELINELKNQRATNQILLWTKGMKAWADLYEFHDILDELGLNRREHLRTSINGSVIVKYDQLTALGQLKTLSSGGFGAVQLNQQISIGQTVTVELKSEQLGQTVSAKATVQYISDTGFYGFKFQALNMEAKSLIIDYIKNHRSQMSVAA